MDTNYDPLLTMGGTCKTFLPTPNYRPCRRSSLRSAHLLQCPLYSRSSPIFYLNGLLFPHNRQPGDTLLHPPFPPSPTLLACFTLSIYP
ncbi:hypothetical protein ACJQWK_10637 [Exserohilum turcicum]